MSFVKEEQDLRKAWEEDMKDQARRELDPPRKTMAEILSMMQASDEGMLELSPDEMKQLGTDAEVKVDGYYHMITKYLAESARLASIAKSFATAAAAHAAQADRMKSALCYHMKENGFTTLPGQDWKVSLRTSREVIPKLKIPTQEIAFNVEFSQYVRVKYEWDKVAIGASLKTGPDTAASELADFREKYWPDFDVKGLKA